MAAAFFKQPVLIDLQLNLLTDVDFYAHLKYGSSRDLRLLKSELNLDSSQPGIDGEAALQPADTTWRGVASSRAANSGSMGISGKGAGCADGCCRESTPVC